MKKIAVVTNYFPTSAMPWGGHSAYQTLRVLATIFDVHVFYPEMTYPKLLTPPGHGAAINLAWRPADVTTTYVRCPALPVISRPLNGWSIAHGLLPHVRAFQPDAVLNYMVYPAGFAAVRIAKRLGVPVVLSAIGSDLNRIAPLCGSLTRYALREADVVTTVSHDLAKTAVRLGADEAKTLAILNGCDTAMFHPRGKHEARVALGLEPDAEIVLYVGRLDTRKGLLELVEAIAGLRSTRPKIHAYLLGGGPAQAELNEAIAKARAGDAVTLVAPAPTAQVAVWMGAADLVTLPSYMEGCPNVVIEALASGRPMVATNVGGIPELMDENSGALIAPRDAAALRTALDQVLKQSWNAEAIAAAHNRSWADVAVDLKRVLDGAMEKS